MKYLAQSLITACILTYGVSLHAQNTIPAAGGNATGSDGIVTFTLGQVVYKTVSGTSGTLLQGVQQPYEISIVTAIEEAKDISLSYSVYPNPTTNYLTLKIGDYDNQKMVYWLYSMGGKLIETKKVIASDTQISMNNLTTGTYFLKITSGNFDVKTFKIIKN